MFKTLFFITPLSLLFLTACAQTPRKVEDARIQSLPSMEQNFSQAIGASSSVTSPTLNLEILEDEVFISAPLTQSNPLPKITIDAFSISNANIQDVMGAILAGTKIPFSIDSESPASNTVKMQMTVTNVSGELEKILEMFSSNYGFYYTYVDGVLHISPDRQYIAKVPPINELFDSLPLMLKQLGATDIFLEKTSRSLTYRASKPVQSKVGSYLKWIRENQKLIVFETYIAEVVLNDSANAGIQWNKLGWAGNSASFNITGGAAAAAATGTLSVGSILSGNNFNMDVLAGFLKTQGTVNQLSKIPMMMLAGGEATLRNGSTDYYVSSVGAPTVAANGATTQGTSVLSPLNTGVDLKITGNVYNGTIFTTVNLVMNTLIGYQSFPAGNGLSQLAPRTTDRTVNTAVRIRPGDTIVIAGINYEKFQSDISGLPGWGQTLSLLSNKSKTTQRGELVIVMSPRIISFNGKTQNGGF